MTDVLGNVALKHDEIANRAQTLINEAQQIWLDPQATADDYDKAENAVKMAEQMLSKSRALQETMQASKTIIVTDPTRPTSKQGLADAGKWSSFAEFLQAVKATDKGVIDERLVHMEGDRMVATKALAGTLGASGGFLSPTQFVPNMLALSAEASIVESRATVLPMETRTLEMPALRQGMTTANQTHYFGGMQVFYEGESSDLVETDTDFRLIKLEAWDLTSLIYVPQRLLNDTPMALETWLTGPMGMAGAFAHRADYAYLRGTGTGQPLGVLNAPATIGISRAGAGTIAYDDLVNLFGRSMATVGRIWVAHTMLRPTLMLMSGPSGNASYLWSSARDGQPDRLLGLPIVFTEKLPTKGTKGDILLADFTYYLVGRRENLLFDTSDAPRWAKNQIGYKGIMRHDGQPWLDLPFTLMDGSSSISPFVVVNT